MTTEEAKTIIVKKVLSTKDGWRRAYKDVFSLTTIYTYVHEDLPEVTIEVEWSFVGGGKPSCTYSIEAAGNILAMQKDPNGQIASIVMAAEGQSLKEKLAKKNNKLIVIAQSI